MAKKTNVTNRFHIEFLNGEQKMAWAAFQEHDVLFLMGSAGTGKSYLAMAFAVNEVLQNNKSKIVICRPIVEAGESLGFLPGDFQEKVNPYMMPLYDSIDKLVGKTGPQRDAVMAALEVAPIAYMRGRAESLNSVLPTPIGPIRMGDIKVGDLVFSSDGSPTKVMGVYPQGKKEMYRVKFSDRTWVDCSEDHLWSTMTLNEKRHDKGFTVKTTKSMLDNVKNKWNQKIHRVPVLSAPAAFCDQKIGVDPYVLGVLLGDGHIGIGQINLCTSDSFIKEEIEKRLPEKIKLVHRSKYDYSIEETARETRRNPFFDLMSDLGLCGKLSYEKSIPDAYKYNSAEVRLEVLRGLLDTDGSVSQHRSGSCRIQYYSTSKVLSDDVMYVVRSLGGAAYCRKREYDEDDSHDFEGCTIIHARPCYVVDIIMPKLNPFKLPRKAERFTPQKPVKLISSIKHIGCEECQCIRVDAKDSLYLTNEFIVTHNTFDDAVCIFDEAQNATYMQLKLFLTRFGKNSKVIVTGDLTQSDIGRASGLGDVVEKASSIQGVGKVEFGPSCVVRHPMVAKLLEKLND